MGRRRGLHSQQLHVAGVPRSLCTSLRGSLSPPLCCSRIFPQLPDSGGPAGGAGVLGAHTLGQTDHVPIRLNLRAHVKGTIRVALQCHCGNSRRQGTRSDTIRSARMRLLLFGAGAALTEREALACRGEGLSRGRECGAHHAESLNVILQD